MRDIDGLRSWSTGYVQRKKRSALEAFLRHPDARVRSYATRLVPPRPGAAFEDRNAIDFADDDGDAIDDDFETAAPSYEHFFLEIDLIDLVDDVGSASSDNGERYGELAGLSTRS